MSQASVDTIAAIATPAGPGALGIVRLSGPAAVAIAGRVFRGRGGEPSTFASHTVHFGHVISGGNLVDTVLLTVLRAPHSYTGEETVELSCHGGRVVVQRVLAAVVAAGARPAQAGEFTRRAFFNGKMDLAQAEAVQELIAAESALGVRVAAQQLEGRLSREVNVLRKALVELLAEVEAHIDFPDEAIEPADSATLLDRLQFLQEHTTRLVETFDEGRRVRDGVHVVLVGKPNVGKSSLLNALLEEERAIVTPEPGTTRDVLRESLVLQGLALTVIDTAGLRSAGENVGRCDAAETEGMRRSRQALEQADLVLLVLDMSHSFDDGDRAIVEAIGSRPFIVAANKVDVPPLMDASDLDALIHDRPVVRTSALEKTGLDELKAAIIEAAWPSGLPSSDATLITQVRHRDALRRASEAFDAARQALDDRRALELAAVDLREGLDALGEIVGAVTTDEILDNIFSRFCIGK